MIQLGMIPDWQFSPDPNLNHNINPHLTMPEGMYQAGVLYTQPAYGPMSWCPSCPPKEPPLAGLGFAIAQPYVPWHMPNYMSPAVAQGRLGDTTIFDSWAWRNRRAIAGAAAAALIVGLFTALK